MAEWDDAAFFDRVGVMRPRTGGVGVSNIGGMAAPSARPVRPAVVQQPPTAGPAGRPAEPSAGISNAGPGAPAELTMKFHEPPEPPEPPEPASPVPNPMGQPVQTPEGTSMVLSPEGKGAYAGERLRIDELFGPHPFLNDPHAPKPQLTPGKPFFNPFFGWGS